MSQDESYNSKFQYNKYDPATDELGSNYYAGSDNLASTNRLIVSFQHVPTEKSVFFKAFITTFNESYNCDWTPETVYGRGDPIYQFKNTQRKITLAFKVPAASSGEAYENLGRVQQLIQFLYPRYSEVNSATTISQAPLIRLKVMNLLRNVNDTFQDQDAQYESSPTATIDVNASSDKLDNYKTLQRYYSHDGVLGVIDNVAVTHGLESDEGAFMIAAGTILPKLLEITVNFSAIHEHTMGWSTDDLFGKSSNSKKAGQTRLFPYGVALDSPPSVVADALNAEGMSSTGDTEEDPQQAQDNANAGLLEVMDGLGAQTDMEVSLSTTSEKLAAWSAANAAAKAAAEAAS
jgi:hypothetical protein